VAGHLFDAVIGLVTDGGKVRVVVDGIASGPGKAVVLMNQLVEGVLVVSVGQPAARLPGILRRWDDDVLGLRHRRGRDEAGEDRDQGNGPANITEGEYCCLDEVD
jgi:hypothetical protein